MALEPRIRVLELTRWHLDQPLSGCGALRTDEARIVSEIRYTALEQAFQTAQQRHVDLIVLHSGILSPHSESGRAPWYLARLIEASVERGVPVVWIEPSHNAWMTHHLAALPVTRLTPGAAVIVSTPSGQVRVVSESYDTASRAEEIATVLVTASGTSSAEVDLVLAVAGTPPRTLDEWTTAARGAVQPLAVLHTTRREGAPDREPLAVSCVGQLTITCGLGSGLTTEMLFDPLWEELESASARYLATHPGLELLVVDLVLSGVTGSHGALWNRREQGDLRDRIRHRQTLSGGCGTCWSLRSIHPHPAPGNEGGPYTDIIEAIWNTTTQVPGAEARGLVELVPEYAETCWWGSGLLVSPGHPLAADCQRAVIHRLRSAG